MFIVQQCMTGVFCKALTMPTNGLQALRRAPPRRPPVVIRQQHKALGLPPDFDVCVCGGTLGLFIGLALQVEDTTCIAFMTLPACALGQILIGLVACSSSSCHGAFAACGRSVTLKPAAGLRVHANQLGTSCSLLQPPPGRVGGWGGEGGRCFSQKPAWEWAWPETCAANRLLCSAKTTHQIYLIQYQIP